MPEQCSGPKVANRQILSIFPFPPKKILQTISLQFTHKRNSMKNLSIFQQKTCPHNIFEANCERTNGKEYGLHSRLPVKRIEDRGNWESCSNTWSVRCSWQRICEEMPIGMRNDHRFFVLSCGQCYFCVILLIVRCFLRIRWFLWCRLMIVAILPVFVNGVRGM
jgi:hypothetical protein